jgi:hypothetical protein
MDDRKCYLKTCGRPATTQIVWNRYEDPDQEPDFICDDHALTYWTDRILYGVRTLKPIN